MDAVGVVEIVLDVELVEVQWHDERGIGRREEGGAEERQREVGAF